MVWVFGGILGGRFILGAWMQTIALNTMAIMAIKVPCYAKGIWIFANS